MNKKFMVPHKQCDECPFREKSLAGYFGPYDPADYWLAAHADDLLPCHMTTPFKGQERHCTGVALFRSKVCKFPRNPKQAAHQNQCVEKYGTDGILGRDFREHHGMDK